MRCEPAGPAQEVTMTPDERSKATMLDNLRTMLRAGANDTEIATAITDAVANKWAGHSIGARSFRRPARTMSSIGG